MKKYFWVGVVLIVALGLFMLWPRLTAPQTQGVALPASAYKITNLVMGKGKTQQVFSAEIADTPALQELGLSYRSSIASTDAMLFVFPQPANLQFWMKDMNFPLDIIWLSSDKKVVFIENNLSPATYPQAFGPTAPSQYVVEVAAGTASRLGLSVGDQVSFTCGEIFCMR